LGITAPCIWIELQEGSTVFVNRVGSRGDSRRSMERVAGVKRGDAPRDAMEAYNALNTLLEQDNGTGALLEPGGAQILDFPGRRVAAHGRKIAAPAPIISSRRLIC
jgi:hypothetical protein